MKSVRKKAKAAKLKQWCDEEIKESTAKNQRHEEPKKTKKRNHEGTIFATNHSVNRSVDHLVNNSINFSILHVINDAINHSVNYSAIQSANP